MMKHNLIWKIGDKVKVTNEEPINDMSGRTLNNKVGTLIRYYNGRYHIEFSKGDIVPMFSNQLATPNWYAGLPSKEMQRLIKNESKRKNTTFDKVSKVKSKSEDNFFGDVISSYSSDEAVQDGVLMKNPRQDNFPECNLITVNLFNELKQLAFKRSMTRVFGISEMELLGNLMLYANNMYVNKKFTGDNDKDFFVTQKTQEGLVVWFVRNEQGKLTAMLPSDY